MHEDYLSGPPLILRGQMLDACHDASIVGVHPRRYNQWMGTPYAPWDLSVVCPAPEGVVRRVFLRSGRCHGCVSVAGTCRCQYRVATSHRHRIRSRIASIMHGFCKCTGSHHSSSICRALMDLRLWYHESQGEPGSRVRRSEVALLKVTQISSIMNSNHVGRVVQVYESGLIL